MEQNNNNTENEEKENSISLGIVSELGEFGPKTIISEAALAQLMHRHPISIKRAVLRGELPRPTRLLGQSVWTAGSILRHLEKRLEAAATETDTKEQKLEQLTP